MLTLLSSAGVGILSASFIIYFKRGDPINFLLSGATTFLGSVFFPVEQLPDWAQGILQVRAAGLVAEGGARLAAAGQDVCRAAASR